MNERNKLLLALIVNEAKHKYLTFFGYDGFGAWLNVWREFGVSIITVLIDVLFILLSPVYRLLSILTYPFWLIAWCIYKFFKLKNVKGNARLEQSLKNFKERGDWRKDR